MLPQEEWREIRRARRSIQTTADVAGEHLDLVCIVVVIAQRHSALTTTKFDGHTQKRFIC